jgi:phosphatidylserine/phosphatidylglycerophosphate/cardiolipin synthase-like enzyme
LAIQIFAISNCDDATIFWRVEKRIPDCYGFAIERERRRADGSVLRDVLANRAGFAKDKPQPGESRPSTEWPFQRFSWTDHEVSQGDVVRYRVTPMVRVDGQLTQHVSESSKWTTWQELSADAGDRISAYFNRGLLISQFMARYLEQLRVQQDLKSLDEALGFFKKSLDDHELPIRRFLAGELRLKMLDTLSAARKAKQHVWAALYELDDDELITALEKLGARGHIVLANGSIEANKGETAAEARKRDQNKKARGRLEQAGLEVHARMVSPGALGHNKFLVLTNEKEKPLAAWTGSTNWTKTGLCTQINNGLFVQNGAFAAEYLAQWQRLRDAGSAFPQQLVAANMESKPVKVGKTDTSIWFTRTRKGVDLTAIQEVLEGAKEAVLFLMFQPGAAGSLAIVRKLATKPGMYVKGVVSTLPQEADSGEEPAEVSVRTVGDGEVRKPMDLDIVQPQGIARPFSSWAATVTRRDFLFGPNKVGFAIVHSKLIVVDPFTNPTVITGSHNFSGSASSKNDENFVILRDNQALAQEYAAHILSVYQHYRWLNVVYELQNRRRQPFVPLQESADWQDRHLKGAARREMEFWVR